MALNSSTKSAASEKGGVVHPSGTVDAKAVSDALGIKRIQIALGAFTQNSTVKAYGGPLGFRGKLIGAYFSAEVLPIGGTLSVGAAVYDATLAAEVILASVNPEVAGSTALIGNALTLNATLNDPFIIEPTDTLRGLSVADNNTVGTAMVSGVLTLLIVPIEPTTGPIVTER